MTSPLSGAGGCSPTGAARRPVFVLGFARSGTTLLYALLNAHSRIRLVMEPHMIRRFRALGLDYRATYGAERREAVVHSLPRKQRERLGAERVERFRRSRETFTFKQAYESLLPVPDEPGCVWGEKSPENLHFLEGLLALYPDAYCVHIVRDPRAVFLSKYRKKFHAKARVAPRLTVDSILYAMLTAMRWRAAVAHGCAVLSRRPAEDWCQIRFEDLVTDPGPHLRRICGALRLEFDERMLDPNVRKQDKALEHQRTLAREPVSKERAEAWRELPDWAVWLVERQCATLMNRFGYAEADLSPAWRKRMLCAAVWLLRGKGLRRSLRSELSRSGADAALESFL